MRIVLVNPSVHRGSRYIPSDAVSGNYVDYLGAFQPLGLLSIAAVAREHGYGDIHLVDAQAQDLSACRAAERITALKPDIVGISCLTFSFLYVLELARRLKALSRAFIVVGGPHVGIYPREVLSHRCFDAAVAGEGEYAFRDLVGALDAGRLPGEGIPGLVYRDAGGVVVLNPPRPVDELDSLPFPARDLLPQKAYSSTYRHARFASLISTRGCPYGCSYCSHFPFYDRVRSLSPSKVVEEIGRCAKLFNTRYFQFFDDTFLLDKPRVLEICRRIRAAGLDIEYMISTRVDLLDAELARELSASGCRCVSLGVETGDQRLLDSLQKGTSVSQSRRALELCRDNNMDSVAFFLVGAPGEDRVSVENTVRFIREAVPSWLKANVFVPYPASPLYRRMVAEGSIGDIWREMTLSGTASAIPSVCEAFSARELRRICARINLLPYMRRRSNLRNLRKIGNPRDILWTMKWVCKLVRERLLA